MLPNIHIQLPFQSGCVYSDYARYLNPLFTLNKLIISVNIRVYGLLFF
ncbi:hypothetical protein SAMN04488057_10537 [Cyclobacterium lianum]|uniref:Uncharacterized protein n=1 Tax=Cyclobacterium lianum TaxID=388280 RepID=A0A1M7N3G8_9BACT|nr:hypothetical protein [Cyclobacterium lianum]SHM98082.1 hypothetical protein SAMN04488057_10537 [Cyclobacterium lianum]